MKALPLSDYHEDMGDVLWWRFPIVEPPYVGSPTDLGHTVVVHARTVAGWSETTIQVDGWPGCHTHFTPIDVPSEGA